MKSLALLVRIQFQPPEMRRWLNGLGTRFLPEAMWVRILHGVPETRPFSVEGR